MDSTSKKLIESICALPTMAFHETAVSTFVRWYAQGIGCAVSEDAAGNLLVRYEGKRGAGLTLTAHMDHPGFEVIAGRGKEGTVALWGKVDPKVFAGSRVIVQTAQGPVRGRIGKCLAKKHLKRHTFSLRAEGPIAKGDFGAYDLTPVRIRGDRIEALAADNLMSVAAILDLLTRFAKRRAKVNVAGLFTRGEEAGFLGAFAAMENGFVPKDDPLIVLECSSAPGGKVEIGGGPVLRVGDLQSVYDVEVDIWMADVAAQLAKRQKGFQYQRALLQGGRCEACVYVAEGYRTGGIAFPLGNYHNHGPRGKPAVEHISARDYAGMLVLLEALAKHPMPKGALTSKVAPIWKHYRKLKKKFLASG